MRIEQRVNSETFADFTLSRVPQRIRDLLTDEHYNLLPSALIARDEASRHRIDSIFNLPLFFRSFYFSFFTGRDQRISSYRLEDSRRANIPGPLRLTFHYVVSFGLTLATLSFMSMVLYKLKNLVGIDTFPGFHPQDLWSSGWIQATYEHV
ncbi:MAG: hypothetical protein GY744_14700 [Gammaproteobacteria bacterium]|nr:hypothetical protein [Gammaproteobacteria bacterium]